MEATQKFYVFEADAVTAYNPGVGLDAHEAQEFINEILADGNAPEDIAVIRGNVVPLDIKITATIGVVP